MEEIKKILEPLKNQMDEIWESYQATLETSLASLKASLEGIPKPPSIPFDFERAAALLSKLSRPSPPVTPDAGADPLRNLKESLHRLDAGKTQVEILDAFLEEASKNGARVALFIYKGEQVMGWKGLGFTRLGSDDGRIKAIALPLSEGNPLHTVLKQMRSLHYQPLGEDMLSRRLDGPRPERILLIPMVIRDKVAAALYADDIKGATPLNADALEILTWCASLAVNLLGQRQMLPSPTLTPGEVKMEGVRPTLSVPPVVTAPPMPRPPSAPAVSERTQKLDLSAMQELEALRRETLKKSSLHPELRPVPELPRPEPAAPPPAPCAAEPPSKAPEPEVYEPDYAPEPGPEKAADPEVEMYSTPEAPPMSEWADAEPMPAVVPEPPASMEEKPLPKAPVTPAAPVPSAQTAPMRRLDEEAPKRSLEVKPPPGFRKDKPGFGFENIPLQPGMNAEESRRHDEARRFARLLVSEIKLYNEPKVEEGRKNQTLMALLKEDIERSRQIYDERIAPEIRTKSDYFRQALVSILGNGDAAALGQ